ncbi:potassium channel subfamily K member 16-like, partial [Clarias magur]
MAQVQVTSTRFSWTTLLALSQFTYLLLGATVFQLLEKEAESQNRNHFQMEKLSFLANYTCLDGAALEKFVQVILDARESGVNPSGNSTNPSNWDFGSSFFFAGTVVTTIGKLTPNHYLTTIRMLMHRYGNLSPTTYPGQVFCVFYALCGIPLNLAFLNQLSKCLSMHLGRLEHRMVSMVPHKQCVEVLTVTLFLLMGSVLFLIFPPVIFSYVEDWSYGEGFYYVFITLSTIGFGDYVVGNGQEKQNVSLYRCLAAVWIIFALAWLALLLNIGARIMEHFLGLKQPSVTAGDEQRSSFMDDISKYGMSLKTNNTSGGFWKFTSSAVFAAAVVTTIGYGNVVPTTTQGRVFCVIFAIFGIPLNMVVLNQVGKYMLAIERNFCTMIAKKTSHQKRVLVCLHFSLFIASGILYLVVPMMFFQAYEGWTLTEGMYYCFITLSTVGFGDFVA